METIVEQAFRTATPIPVIVLRCAAASLLGLVIGFEREARERPAGLRTHMLTSLAAALFTLIAVELIAAFGADDEVTQLDPIRVVEAVTTGVAFIAAGAIIQARGDVRGLTTGAGMWLAGAVGLACGAGFLTIAMIGTGLGIIILFPLRMLEKRYFEEDDDGGSQ